MRWLTGDCSRIRVVAEPGVAGVILAAGAASRMGSPKQLLPLEGRPLLQHVIDRADRAGLDGLVVVLGHAHTRIEDAISLPGHARIVVNPDFAQGQSASLARGLESLGDTVRAAVILLADEPRVPEPATRTVVQCYLETGGPVVRARYRGRPGHPVVLDRSIWAEVVTPGTDRGAGPALARHPEWVVDVELDLDPPITVDTPEDYEALTGRSPPDL